jgi:hypothetical protein
VFTNGLLIVMVEACSVAEKPRIIMRAAAMPPNVCIECCNV